MRPCESGTSIEAWRLGAVDHLIKPINQRRLRGLSRTTEPAVLQVEVEDLSAQVPHHGHFGHLCGLAPSMLRVYEQISPVARTGVTMCITGESGTGKGVVAKGVPKQLSDQALRQLTQYR